MPTITMTLAFILIIHDGVAGSICNVEIRFQGADYSSVNKGKAVLIDVENHKGFSSTLKNGKSLFKDLPSGKYSLGVTSNGFRGTYKRIDIDCNQPVNEYMLQLEPGKTSDRFFALDGDFELSDTGELLVGDTLGYMRNYWPLPRYSGICQLNCVVVVDVTVDEKGKVLSAKAEGEKKSLVYAAEVAAKRSRFFPVIYNGKAYRSRGTVTYTFPIPTIDR
ncbi:MAG: energy transducer TonB [Acidobacteria bacterium]|nr:energy transducer TonB [Acidobacteriota bacterium]